MGSKESYSNSKEVRDVENEMSYGRESVSRCARMLGRVPSHRSWGIVYCTYLHWWLGLGFTPPNVLSGPVPEQHLQTTQKDQNTVALRNKLEVTIANALLSFDNMYLKIPCCPDQFEMISKRNRYVICLKSSQVSFWVSMSDPLVCSTRTTNIPTSSCREAIAGDALARIADRRWAP